MSDRQKKKLVAKEAYRQKRRMIEKLLSNSKSSNSALNLNLLLDGWLELESDPATFSLLIEDFGCAGAQVDEVYDLEQKFDSHVMGFIFLFKLGSQTNDRSRGQKSFSSLTTTTTTTSSSTSSSNAKDDKTTTTTPNEAGQKSCEESENQLQDMFFAKQMISNSCATHALISILLNCDHHELDLGPILTRLKEHTKSMDAESKGYAIGNVPEIAKAHNSHASYSSLYNKSKTASDRSGMSYMISGNLRTNNQHETYHFVSYVPINNHLYELDGLKNHPIDHGPIDPDKDWTEKFKQIIRERLSVNEPMGDESSISNDIRYNLMAVVPDKRVCMRSRICNLERRFKNVQENLDKLTKGIQLPLPTGGDALDPITSSIATKTASETGSNHRALRDKDHSDDKQEQTCLFVKFNRKLAETNMDNSNQQIAELDLRYLLECLQCEIKKARQSLKEEVDKRNRYKLDNARRTHNYEPFIMTFLIMLAKHGNLADLIEKDMGIQANSTPQSTSISNNNNNNQASTSNSLNKSYTSKTQSSRANSNSKHPIAPKEKPKYKYKYVKTGRPVGRPRKYPRPEDVKK